MSYESYATMTRFFAHLCLFLQMIESPIPPFATQVILEAYLQVLEVQSTLLLLLTNSPHPTHTHPPARTPANAP
jgi:hypothetical protein